MANQIRIHTACEIIQDNDVTVEGITYSDKKLDGNADSRSWGGNYNLSTAYTDADVCYWKNVVVSQTSAGAGLSNSAWTEASDVTDGTIPATAYVVAVEYVEQSIGSASAITVQVSGETFALLTPGESIVIPMHMGEAVADIEVFDANYGNGTREAKVNVMIAGT
tara:strand:+ start:336 stop:830 length:495 start_codon:yes stop_codon:yes gene_type:complete